MSDLDFGKTRIVKGRCPPFPISLHARLQAARGVPQAVVRISSYAHGAQEVKESIDYISRNGELPLETESGEIVVGREEQKELLMDWSRDFSRRINGRDSVHMAFSMPAGSDVEKLKGAVRTVLTKHFQGHEAVFAIHLDRPQPHAHVVMKMRNRETRKQIDIDIPGIHRLREAFAKAACEQGIELAASPRAARGVGIKGSRQSICQMKRRGVTPRVERQAFNEAISEFEQGLTQEKPWEKAQRERNEYERKAYQEEAQRLRTAAGQQKVAQDQAMRQELLKAAADLERFSKEMPAPKTRRQEYLEGIAKIKGVELNKPDRSSGEEMER